ncbi:hypothetical protein [Chryseobacterium sp. MA9]|uniref:hypothetical protein n=1 Tax=Chryseobacterium sp. MA9 TaxID=2966625 RepID=UPI0021068FC2|nr:hypothetical protein [Chryseobacterium sp. MA9]UTX46813.1 hypothetical protein KIK00_12695 [Chryseobacterium sp. MA9]
MKNLNKKTQVKNEKTNKKTMKTFDFKKFEQKLLLAQVTYQLELEERLRNEAKGLYFEMDCEEQIWVYKDSKVVADICIEEEWENKIVATINISPYSKVTFKKVKKKLRDFLFNEWTREQYEKLEIIESCMSGNFEHWKDH